MPRKNRKIRITTFEYIVSSFFLSLVYIMSYPKYIQSIAIKDFNIFWTKEEFLLLLFIMPIFSLILALFSYKSRSILNIIINTMLPILVMISFVVGQYSTVIFLITYGMIFIILVAGSVLYYMTKCEKQQKRFIAKVMKNGVFIVLLIMLVPSYFYYENSTSSQKTDEYYEDLNNKAQVNSEYSETGGEYPKEFEKLGEWDTLNVEEKYDLLNCVFAFQCRTNNMTVIPFKAIKIDKQTMTFGAYDDDENIVYIDQIHLAKDPVDQCVATVLHEFRHYYQYCTYSVINEMKKNNINYKISPYFNQADEWTNAASEYEENKNYRDYYENLLEIDARDFSKSELKKFEYLFVK